MRFIRPFFIVFVPIVLSLAGGFNAKPADAAQSLTIYVLANIPGPDGKLHEAFVPSSFVVKAGVPVTITFINYGDERHNFVEPKLDIDLVVNAGKQVGATVQPVRTRGIGSQPSPG